MAGGGDPKAARDSLPRVRGVLIDLDGVVYVGENAISGAVDAIRRLRGRGLALRFLTNTSTKRVEEVGSRLAGLGIDVRSGEVMSAVRAAVMTLRRLSATAPYLVVDPAVSPVFAEFNPVGSYPQPPDVGRSPDFIVIGDIGHGWTYDLMNELFELVLKGARIIALHKGRAWQTQEGLRLDIGAFVAGLEYAAGTAAVVTGKPSPGFFRAALEDMGVEAAEALMIGDDIESDVGGAQAVGIRSVLVRTGKYRDSQVRGSDVVPWKVLSSLAEIETVLPYPTSRNRFR